MDNYHENLIKIDNDKFNYMFSSTLKSNENKILNELNEKQEIPV